VGGGEVHGSTICVVARGRCMQQQLSRACPYYHRPPSCQSALTLACEEVVAEADMPVVHVVYPAPGQAAYLWCWGERDNDDDDDDDDNGDHHEDEDEDDEDEDDDGNFRAEVNDGDEGGDCEAGSHGWKYDGCIDDDDRDEEDDDGHTLGTYTTPQ